MVCVVYAGWVYKRERNNRIKTSDSDHLCSSVHQQHGDRQVLVLAGDRQRCLIALAGTHTNNEMKS